MKKLHIIFSVLLVLFVGFLVTACTLPEINREHRLNGIVVNLKEDKVQMELGETYEIQLEVINAVATFEYQIDDQSIISIQDGVITALGAGETKVHITAICNDKDNTTKQLTLSVKVIVPVYTISFASNIDGFEKASQEVEAGSNLSLGAAPRMQGYEFVGWSLTLDGEIINEIANVNSDLVVYAIYREVQQQPNTFTISYTANVEGFNKENDIVEEGASLTLGAGVELTGYNFIGWSLSQQGELITVIENITSDLVVYAIYEVKSYTITYILDGGTYDGATSIQHGATIQLGTPSKENCTFLGWSLEQGSANYVTSISNPTANVVLYANWEQNALPPQSEYAITYDLDGGYWDVEFYSPSETGREFIAEFNAFANLSLDPDELDTDNMSSTPFGNFFKNADNLAKWMWLLDAVWEVAGGDESTKASTANFGSGAVIGFYMANLNGYFTSTKHTDTWLGNVSADYSVAANSNAVKAKGPAKSGEIGPASYQVGVGVASFPAPLREDYIFAGWVDATGASVTSISATQTGDLALKAVWEPEPNEFAITYDLDGGHWYAEYYTPAEIGRLFITDFNAFANLSLDPDELDTDNMSSTPFGNFFKNADNLAKWMWLLDAVWEVAGGDESTKASTANFGSGAVIGFYMANFNGYFTSTRHTDTWLGNMSADYSVAANSEAVTMKSEPKAQQEVPTMYTKGVGLAELPTPLRDLFVFAGWVDASGAPVTAISTTQKGALTLKATWVAAEIEYDITYVLDGGSYEGQAKIGHGQTLQLGTPEREGFTFLGWSLQQGSTEYVTEVVVTSNISIYANWEEIYVIPEGQAAITYDLDGGHWVYVYYTPAEVGALFLADFKAFTGLNLSASQLDTDHMSSTQFGNFFKDTNNFAKWKWLLDAVWEVGEGQASYKPDVADFGTGAVIGFYLANFNGYFTGTQHTDTWLNKESANYADPDNTNAVTVQGNPKEELAGPATYVEGEGLAELPTPIRSEYVFAGWIDAAGAPVTSISAEQIGAVSLKATWEHETIAESITFTNLPEEGVKLYNTLQLEWVVTPLEAVNKNVLFYAMDANILSITDGGELKGVSLGTGRIRVRLESNPDFEQIISINVWSGDFFDVSYDTESYVEVGHTIVLNAEYIDQNQVRHGVTWSSLNDDIAIVDASGLVTGVASGVATIRASYTDEIYFDFYVTVLAEGVSEELQFILNNHNSNAKTTYNLGIGDGNPEYYYDVVGSANNLLFDGLKIDRRYYDKLPEGTKNYGVMTSVEFITVHYTGNMKYSADADNNCDYFNNLEYRASIHYVTGRTNLKDLTGQNSGYNEDAYYAFAGLNELYGGWHATNADPCVWDDTGLLVLEGDPATPVISISANMKYTINGRETNINVPAVPDSDYVVNGSTLVYGGKEYSVFNQYGLRTKVVDGKYYLARTHWGTQRSPRALCTCGGNRNSIGIESCVDMGSDLVHTWHVTAQLVAQLLIKYDLGLDRVVGHHFFSGKDCPQPLLENNMDLWNDFMKYVEAEYDLMTKYPNATVSARVISGEGNLKANGLVVQDTDAHCVVYEVTFVQGGVTQTVTLATIVESSYMYTGARTQESLQMQGYPII